MKFERDTIDSAVRRTVGSGPRLSRSDHHHGLINRINPSKKDACACACMRLCVCGARARAPFCVAACLDCLRVSAAAWLHACVRLRACVYQSLDRSIYAARFSFLLDIRLLHPLLASLPRHSLPPPALVVTPSLSLSPLSLSLSLSLVYSSLSPSARFFEPNYPDFVSSDPTIN